jgi:hypothetical protein
MSEQDKPMTFQMHRHSTQNHHHTMRKTESPNLTFHQRSSTRIALFKSLAALFVALACLVQSSFAGQGHWVTTWGCGPQLTEPANLPPVALANSTLRQFVHVTIGGNHLRVRLSNAYGTNSVTLNSVHVPGRRRRQRGQRQHQHGY